MELWEENGDGAVNRDGHETESNDLFPVYDEILRAMLNVVDIRSDPLLMNAFNTVNLAAACLLTSTDYARELGIPEDRWIYPLGGAGTQDANNCKLSNKPHCLFFD